jgi:hypothetical protein
MLKKSFFISLFLLGCSIASRPPEGTYECPVCKQNGDLACLYVDPKIKKNAPYVTIDKQTYYFCSEECKEEFLKQHEQK